MSTFSGLLIISCLLLLGSSRLRVSIRMVAVQGIILGLLPFVRDFGHFQFETWTIGLGGFALKGILLPWFLMRVLRQSAIRREIEPFIGFNISLMIGIGLLGLSCWIALFLWSSDGAYDPGLTAAALFMMLSGLFLIISRRKAITQALGYLVMENGIYVVGISVGHDLHALIELGVMLDVFVGVFLMGIMAFHIHTEFDHIDTDRLRTLSDLPALQADGEHAPR